MYISLWFSAQHPHPPELSAEVIIAVAGDVGVDEGGRGEDYGGQPDEGKHQTSGLETNQEIY